jgi:outer membrane lipoprotein SlyB
MTEDRDLIRETTVDDGEEHREVVERVHSPGAPRHGDEQAGGAVAGGVAGAVAGTVVGGPVGTVVGGAIGATAGATAGLADEKSKDGDARDRGDVVVERTERRG